MENMMRNDSTSVISSLQMDYADSDDEDTDRKSAPKDSVIIERTSVTTDNIISVSETIELIRDFSGQDSEQEEPSGNILSQTNGVDDPEKENDPEGELEVRPDELISDDEDGEQHHHRNHPLLDRDALRIQAVLESVKTESPSSQGSTNPGRKAARLVSYGPDEDLDEDDSSDSSDEKDYSEDGTTASPELNNVDTSILTRSVQNMASDDIKIPPEPPGKCSNQIQKKIEDMYDRMRKEGLDLNRTIQSKKNFRNPSIYEKLIDYCHIDEKGTNFPPEIYDPHIWGKESLYDELDKAQRKDMERREKEKKKAPDVADQPQHFAVDGFLDGFTFSSLPLLPERLPLHTIVKSTRSDLLQDRSQLTLNSTKELQMIEFMVGTKKSATSADSLTGQPDEKKRKTKWDAQPTALIHVSKIPSANQNPGIVNLTAVATGTKATVIPAVGSLSKKSSSSSSGK